MPFKEFESLLKEDLPTQGGTAESRPGLLVIDDDESIRTGLAAVFAQRYSLILAASAPEGVAALTEAVRVAILDVKMKGFDGFWACDALRKASPNLPIIFYSAYQDLKDPYQIINEHRPFAYLTKNGDRRRLIEAVDLAVRLSNLARINQQRFLQLKAKRDAKRDPEP